MGLILLFLSPYLLLSHNMDFRIFFCSIISLLLGSYVLSYYDIFNYFTDRISLNTTIEYMSFYLIPVALSGYIMMASRNLLRKICISFFLTNSIFVMCVVLMALMNTMLISEHTTSLHILCLSEGIIILSLIIRNFHRKSPLRGPDSDNASDVALLTGITGFLICAVIDIIKYTFAKYRGAGGEANNDITFTTFGALFFVMCLLVSYFFYRLSEISSQQKNLQLENLAYLDPLTGLANRARCENFLSALSGSDLPYFIISIDLDHLKLVNDTWGHPEGDRWLSSFAVILQDTFWDASLIGRMGGDEFLIVQEHRSCSVINSRLQDLQTLLSGQKSPLQKIHYGFSYGCAASSELSGTGVSGLYQLADNRMYQMKQQRHMMQEGGRL
jgi:diguanylate cyclase (GGDEF)-like protein